MNEDAVRLWIQKAEDDYEAGKLLMQTPSPITWIVCFHMQQCAEKYLKAYLVFHGKEFPRTHSIPVLVHLCAQIERSFHKLKEEGVRELSRYATSIRYGEEPYVPDLEEAHRAIHLAKIVRQFVRDALKRSGLDLQERREGPG